LEKEINIHGAILRPSINFKLAVCKDVKSDSKGDIENASQIKPISISVSLWSDDCHHLVIITTIIINIRCQII
jgi:hypothetical protein